MTDKVSVIRSEIERRIEKYNEYLDKVASERTAWKWAECKSLLSFIDSLPEEPMEILADKCEMDETPAPDNWNSIDVEDLIMEPEESSDLEEEINSYYQDNLGFIIGPNDTKKIVEDIARHFAEWGAKHLKK